jgi:uncharacterized protein (TIGR00255 family)
MPREYWSLEEEIRKNIRERIPRGRVELFVSRTPIQGPVRNVELDEKLMGQFLLAWRHAKRRFGLKGDVDLDLLANRPELLQIRELATKEKDERGIVLRTLRTALSTLERSRRREGRDLQVDMQEQAGT